MIYANYTQIKFPTKMRKIKYITKQHDSQFSKAF